MAGGNGLKGDAVKAGWQVRTGCSGGEAKRTGRAKLQLSRENRWCLSGTSAPRALLASYRWQ